MNARTHLLFCLLFFVLPCCSRAGIATEHAVQVGKDERTYTLFAPSSVAKEKPAALVILFHGSGGNGASMDRMSGFSAVAEREGFILALPDALGRNWNDGREVPSIPSMAHGVDDVAFVDAMITEIGALYKLDPKRLYATGFSNGGIFVHLLAARSTHAFAAIAPVSGGIAVPLAPKFKPTVPLSVLILHGTADPMVPYKGGDVDYNSNGSIIATEDTALRWVECDRIKSPSESGTLPDTDPDDGCTVSWTRWAPKTPGLEVALFSINGGGHTWASGPQFQPIAIIGRVCRDIDATEVIWDFFKKHPKK